jgi:hypothetical protein
MEIIGEIAEEKKLTGDENLQMLVSTFREKEAMFYKEHQMLPKMKSFLVNATAKEQAKIGENIEALASGFPLPVEIENIEKAIESLVADYICTGFNMKYDLISEDLFNLERNIKHQYNGKVIDLSIPLFASAEFGKETEWNIKRKVKSDSYHSDDITITASVPPITRDAKEKAKRAKADFLEIYSNALRKPCIGDILLKNPLTTKSFNLSMYWIPNQEELSIKEVVKEKDPLLIAEVYDKNYLVAQWNVLGEKPFEHYLKEFTEMKAKE